MDKDGIKRLRRTYTFKDFQGAMAFSQAVGDEAEAAGHHPILTTEWGKNHSGMVDSCHWRSASE